MDYLRGEQAENENELFPDFGMNSQSQERMWPLPDRSFFFTNNVPEKYPISTIRIP